MKIVVQRVKNAAVNIDGKQVAAINTGMLVLVGIEKDDKKATASYLAGKIANLRIFEDTAGKMNLNIKDVGGSLLVVSQFTLAGDLSRGNRPGFETAARPEEAEPLYNFFVTCLQELQISVQTGIFQTDMQVALINDGPVTFILERR